MRVTCFLRMWALASFAAIAITACNRSNPAPEEPSGDPYFLSLTDFVDTSKKDLELYLDRFYPIFRKHGLLNLRPKEEYLAGYVDSAEIRELSKNHLREQLRQFLKSAPLAATHGPLRYFARKVPGAKKTFIYLNDPATSLVYNTSLLNQLLAGMPGVSIVVIDASGVLYEEHGKTIPEIRALVATGLASVLEAGGLAATEKTLHVICHGIFYANDVLAGGASLYDKAVFYAPTVKNNVKNRLLSPSVLYPKGDRKARFVDYVYQGRISQRLPFQYFPVPRSQQEFNQPLEAAFAAGYETGVSLKGVRNKYLLVPEIDLLVPRENTGADQFKPGRIHVIPDIYHSDIFTRKITSSSYVEKIRTIVDL